MRHGQENFVQASFSEKNTSKIPKYLVLSGLLLFYKRAYIFKNIFQVCRPFKMLTQGAKKFNCTL